MTSGNNSDRFDIGQIITGMLKEELAKASARREEKQREDTYASDETVVRVQREEMEERRFYLTTAIALMADDKTSEGMNYSWQDVVVIAEKIRAYIEGGIYIDTETAWQSVPKQTAVSTATLGDR